VNSTAAPVGSTTSIEARSAPLLGSPATARFSARTPTSTCGCFRWTPECAVYGRANPLVCEERAAITRRHPLGSVVVGTVTQMFPGNRECMVVFDDCLSVVEYDNNEPVRSGSRAIWSGPVGYS
jgi:hypothetical protein